MPQASFPKVAFVAGTLAAGGAEQQLYHMAAALSAAGVPPDVITFSRGEAWERPLEELGVRVMSTAPAGGRVGRLLAMRPLLKASAPDVIQSAHFYTNLYAVVAARYRGCKEVGALRGDVHQELAAHGWLGRRGLHWPRTLAANTDAAAKEAQRRGVPSERIVVVRNAIEPAAWPMPAPRPSWPFEIVFVGRLRPEKRVERVIDAFARLPDEMRARARVSIAGEGPERDRLEALARERRLAEDRVRFLGAVRDVPALLAGAHVLVLTSDHEGAPNVVLEAMASGVAVAASRVGGVEELVEHGVSGLLHDAGDTETLAQHLVRLAEDPETRMALGRSGRERVIARHDLARLPEALARLYDRVLRA